MKIYSAGELRGELGVRYLSKIHAQAPDIPYGTMRFVLSGQSKNLDLIHKVMAAAQKAIDLMAPVKAANNIIKDNESPASHAA